MRADLLNGSTVEVPLEDMIADAADINAVQAIINQKSEEIRSRLPADHAWNGGKVLHQGQTASTLGLYITHFTIPHSAASFMRFIGGIHDLGRPIQGMERLGLQVPEKYRGMRHGLIAVGLLEEWGVLKMLSPVAARLIRYSVGQHDLPTTPGWDTKDPLGSFFLSLIRDADKLAGLLYKTELYLWNIEEKRKQVRANGLAGEQWVINPERLVDDFTSGRIIQNSDCISYESFALRVLAWIHDLNLLATRQLLRESGVVYEYVRYFQQQLPPDQSNRIKGAVELWIY